MRGFAKRRTYRPVGAGSAAAPPLGMAEAARAARSTLPSVEAASALRWFAFLLFGFVVMRRGWLCDDAFISLRAAENLATGWGLVINPTERVQGFTNPLWVLLLAALHPVGADAYSLLMGTSLVVTLLGAWWLGFVVLKRPWVGALALILLLSSEAFADFSTGGLENPLGHLLVIGFFGLALSEQKEPNRAREFAVWCLAALVVVHRLDLLLLVLPSLLVRVLQPPRGRAVWVTRALGLLPLSLWLLFSLAYYGFLLPNTAVAKLDPALPRAEVLGQGLVYLAHSLGRDPTTVAVILLALVMGALGSRAAQGVALGILAYVAYVVWVGGDFMAGRFLSTPFVAGVVLLARQVEVSKMAGLELRAAGVLVGLVVLKSPFNPFVDEPVSTYIPASGIVTERTWYRAQTGLYENLRKRIFQSHPFWKTGERIREGKEVVVEAFNVGMAGYAAGRHRHLVDTAGLTDALLARLPPDPVDHWRPGHLRRTPPAGYLATLRSGKNQLEDPGLGEYYTHLRRVISGPLFTWERWRTIWAFHRQRFDHLLPRASKGKAPPSPVRRKLAALSAGAPSPVKSEH